MGAAPPVHLESDWPVVAGLTHDMNGRRASLSGSYFTNKEVGTLLIKRRTAKRSTRGLYFQDRELGGTAFQPGSHFRYLVDRASRTVLIVPDATAANTVSKRARSGAVVPVIDIRQKAALEAFSNATHLEVEIHDDQVIVTGYVANAQNQIGDTRAGFKSASSAAGQVLHLTDLIAARPVIQGRLSRRTLEQAVGFGQIDLFEKEVFEARTGPAHLSPSQVGPVHIPLVMDSLFAGAGLMDIGFRDAGYKLALAVEIDADAAATHRANFGNNVVCTDIREVPPGAFTSPIMSGGPPCRGFSNSNRHSHFLDNPHNKLVRAFIESVRSNPNAQVFIMENVPQVLTAGGGLFLREIIEELSDFEVSYGVLDAADYGAPQRRKRAILIGGKKIGRIDLPTPTTTSESYATVRQAFAGLRPDTPNQRDVSQPSAITATRMSYVPEGGNIWDIPEHLRPRSTHSDVYKRLAWDEPSITIVNPRKALLTHPKENRVLSVRECARLQGVPDDFTFHGSLAARQQQVANGVPVSLARAVAEAVKIAIGQFQIRTYNAVAKATYA